MFEHEFAVPHASGGARQVAFYYCTMVPWRMSASAGEKTRQLHFLLRSTQRSLCGTRRRCSWECVRVVVAAFVTWQPCACSPNHIVMVIVCFSFLNAGLLQALGYFQTPTFILVGVSFITVAAFIL